MEDGENYIIENETTDKNKKQEYWGKILKKAAKYGSLWYNNYNCHFAHYAERI